MTSIAIECCIRTAQVEFAVNDGTDAFHCQTLPCAYEYGGINSPVRRS